MLKLIFCVILLFVHQYLCEETLIIKQGKIKGTIMKSYSNKSFLAFEGIPYAKPPIGPLRFKEPQLPDPWEGILIANRTYTCVQHIPLPISMGSGFLGTEDCLYINVYAPGEEIVPDANLKVVVHIHGGAFIMGSPNMMAGPNYIMNKNVIYVNFNYRLGIFGFLSTQDDVVPGNNGLKDQNFALKWIQENIKAFGGNPNSITLTGLSAGAASVHYHYLSPKSKGLFHRGMCMSGTVLNPWSLIKNPEKNAKKLGEVMNCKRESNQEMVDCLRGVSARDLGLAIKDFFVFLYMIPIVPFGPVIEKGSDSFINEHPYKMLLDGKIANDVPVIFSCVKDEGIYPAGVFQLYDKLEEFGDRWDELSPYALDFHQTLDDSLKLNATQKIRQFYFKEGEKITDSNVMDSVKVFSDRLFYIGIQEATKLHKKVTTAEVYFYYFTYQLEQFSVFPVRGVAHSFDSKLLFNIITSPPKVPVRDEIMINTFTDMLYAYAKDNKPNVSGVDWKPISEGNELDYLHIKAGDDYGMEKASEFASSEFWESLEIQENGRLF